MDLTMMVAFLSPLLPYLVKGGEAVAESVGKEFGKSVWDRAHAIWNALAPASNSSEALQEVVGDLEKDPANQAARGALVYHLDKLFAKDPALKASVEKIWEGTDKQAVQTVIAYGERSVAGINISGTVITGDVSSDKERHRRP
jgi:hypothetical protein